MKNTNDTWGITAVLMAALLFVLTAFGLVKGALDVQAKDRCFHEGGTWTCVDGKLFGATLWACDCEK